MYKMLRAIGIGEPQDSADILCQSLRASDVPVSTADCRSCADPCDLGHDSYPHRFDVDFSNMVGSVKPYNRQVVISTGKSDWERDILGQKDSLAALLSRVTSNPPSANKKHPIPLLSSLSASKSSSTQDTGVFSSSDATRTSVLNGSHQSLSHEDHHETVLVFPDFKCVSEVPRTNEGAIDLWKTALDPSLGPDGHTSTEAQLKTWVIPYACVILLCSHKKRDNRCGIAAPMLENAFIKSLESRGWEADTHLAHPSVHYGSALEDSENQTPQERERIVTEQLKENAASKRALIVKVSHFGGHKYVGNAVIYSPSGSGVWYGRVTPHDVDSIVENTIIEGLVLPPLLRGGVNLSRPNCTTLNDW